MGNRTYPCQVAALGIKLRAACEGCPGGTPPGTCRLSRGDYLYRQGEPAEALYAVVKGCLREVVVTEDGRQVASRLIHPGAVVGLEALSGAVYQSGVEALRPSQCCEVSADEARAWLESHSGDAFALAQATANELASVRDQLVLERTASAEDRVLSFIQQLARGYEPEQWFQLPVTREQLGELLGLTLETVSRMLQRLRRSGVIDVDGARVRLS
ncbi:MAG: Crp/Fnr family transcriptional regulator, partial [Candidatus Methylomirabilis sp.]|nr:Crp/Fnr family transcriptional regulator [Deltaproteobacteria bacterium]